MHLGEKQFKDQINADLKRNPWCLQKGTAGGAPASPSGKREALCWGRRRRSNAIAVPDHKGAKATCNEDLLSVAGRLELHMERFTSCSQNPEHAIIASFTDD